MLSKLEQCAPLIGPYDTNYQPCHFVMLTRQDSLRNFREMHALRPGSGASVTTWRTYCYTGELMEMVVWGQITSYEKPLW